jgi:hypothetical protein
LVLGRCYDWIPLRMLDREKSDINSRNHLGGRWRTRGWIGLSPLAGSCRKQYGSA